MNNTKLLQIFAETELIISPIHYSILSIPIIYWNKLTNIVESDDFLSITKDHNDEISIIIPANQLDKLIEGSISFQASNDWRLFSFKGEGLLEISGYLAKLCVMLAQNNISIMAFSTYQKSQLLVQNKDFDMAQAILKIFLRQPMI